MTLQCRSLADKVAASGFLVVVPDFFHGDPFSFEKPREAWAAAHTPVLLPSFLFSINITKSIEFYTCVAILGQRV